MFLSSLAGVKGLSFFRRILVMPCAGFLLVWTNGIITLLGRRSPQLLLSVFAREGPDDAARKIPNQRLFAAQFTMASDASDMTVAA
jgi:hypothetical protein